MSQSLSRFGSSSLKPNKRFDDLTQIAVGFGLELLPVIHALLNRLLHFGA